MQQNKIDNDQLLCQMSDDFGGKLREKHDETLNLACLGQLQSVGRTPSLSIVFYKIFLFPLENDAQSWILCQNFLPARIISKYVPMTTINSIEVNDVDAELIIERGFVNGNFEWISLLHSDKSLDHQLSDDGYF